MEKIPEEDNIGNGENELEEELLPMSMSRSISMPVSKGQEKYIQQ